MNKTLKFIGLLAILPLVLVALTPNLIGEADAASPQRNDANINNPDDTSENREVKINTRSANVDADGNPYDDKDTSASNSAKSTPNES